MIFLYQTQTFTILLESFSKFQSQNQLPQTKMQMVVFMYKS